MILKKLYIHNYKSFYDTTIELGKFNIIIGENNSGKSNIIDVLEFIDIAMKKDIERAIDDKGGYDNIKNYTTDEEKIIIRATFEKKSMNSKFISLGKVDYQGILQGEGEYTLSFSFTKSSIFFSVYVDMYFIGTIDNNIIKEYLDKNYDGMSKLKINPIKFIISNKKNFNSKKIKSKLYIPSNIDKVFVFENIQGILLFINILSDKDLNIQQYDSLRKRYIATYYFNTDVIKNQSHEESVVDLKKDGSNLGKNIFAYFPKKRPDFEIISNSLVTTVNELDGINIHEVAGHYVIAFQEGNKEISINKVSDGTINLLATITALNQPIDKSFLLAFEEPERHLHLKAVNYLLDSFRESKKQIIITTHSTEILKNANLEEVIFIYRDSDGDTQSLKATDIPNLEGKMEKLGYDRPLSLDELIADNIIGDFR